MPSVEIYTSPLCGYCFAAKRLLDSRRVAYVEFDVSSAPQHRREMIARADGRRTVPQVFIDGHGIGGCDELHALARSGELDRLLASGGAGA